MTRASTAVCLLVLLAACSTSPPLARPDGTAEYRISCWYFGWHICYDRAKELCGDRYKVIAWNEGREGRELRILCAAGQD